MDDPILCAPLLRQVDSMLIELLASLRPDEWDLPTLAPAWKVRDVAAHLLDTALRKLSLVRDHCFVEQAPIHSPEDLAALVNRLNREGVTVLRRLSPPLLISLMDLVSRESADFHEALDPFAPAAFAVSWAGQEQSLNWFDTARELTERWHHHQQIRHATGRPGLITPALYHPVLDCFLRALPHAYRHVEAPPTLKALVQLLGGSLGAVGAQEYPQPRYTLKPARRITSETLTDCSSVGTAARLLPHASYRWFIGFCPVLQQTE